MLTSGASKINKKKLYIKNFFIVLFATIFLLDLFLHTEKIGRAETNDIEPPKISDVQVVEAAENYATITWKTSEDADSLVNYGLDKNYGIARDPLPDKSSHEIKIDNLEPSTTYHFRVVSSDASNNQSISENYIFTTDGLKNIFGIEKVSSEEEKGLVEKIYGALEKISSEEALSVIASKVGDVAQEIITPPLIIGIPKIEVETDTAAIIWATDKPSNSIVLFSPDYDYNSQNQDPYIFSQGDLNERVTEHKVVISGLKPMTLYHYQVSSQGDTGISGKSEDATFKTKSIIPEISNVQIKKVEETRAVLAWMTNIPSAGLVKYTNTRTGEIRSKGNPELVTSQTIQLTELEFGTTYSAIIEVENENGEKTTSNAVKFITVKDEAPPIISKVTNELTLYPGAESKVQTIISWMTDEPAVCQLFYHQGLSKGMEEKSMQKEEEEVTKHVSVAVTFQPSTVYKYWIICKDTALNKTQSEDFVLFTPEKEKNIIDIIIENFEGTFGWTKNIFQ